MTIDRQFDIAVIHIVQFCFVLLGLTVGISWSTKIRPSFTKILAAIGLATLLTAASLLVRFESGRGSFRYEFRGWPHSFYITTLSELTTPNFVPKGGFNFGYFGSDILSNLFFYFCALTLVQSLIAWVRRSN